MSAAVDEVTGEEALRAVQLESGYARVAARVGVQRLLMGGEGVKQRQTRVARHQLIPVRRLSEVLTAISPGITDGIEGLW